MQAKVITYRDLDFEGKIEDGLRLSKDGTGLYRTVLLKFYDWKNETPRLMIDLSGRLEDLIPISIDETDPKILVDREVPDFEKVAAWIKKKYSALMGWWNREIEDIDVSFLLTDGVTYNEWVRRNFLTLVQYRNGDITYEEAEKLFKKNKTEGDLNVNQTI